MKFIAIALIALWTSSAAYAEISIENPWIRTVPPGAKATGMFMTIINDGTEDDELLSVSSSYAAHNEIHETKKENGIMTMQRLVSLKIPANSKVELKPGSYHVMLIKLIKAYKTDDVVEFELTFKQAGKKSFKAIAKDAKSAGSMSH